MIENKKILCVVTARAGSKGILGKNYRELLGKPLFIWSVEAGLYSKYVDKVIISSNCNDCAACFADFLLYEKNKQDEGSDYVEGYDKCDFIIRPEEFSTDVSKNEEALIHVLKVVGESNYDIVINLQPTSPCRLNGLLDSCIEEYYEGGYDSLLTGAKYTPFVWKKIDGKWKYIVDKNDCCDRKMRQEFEKNETEDNSDFFIHDDGNIYITDLKVLLNKECRIGDNLCVFEIKGINSLQIDEEYDFQLIEQMAKVNNLKSLI